MEITFTDQDIILAILMLNVLVLDTKIQLFRSMT